MDSMDVKGMYRWVRVADPGTWTHRGPSRWRFPMARVTGSTSADSHPWLNRAFMENPLNPWFACSINILILKIWEKLLELRATSVMISPLAMIFWEILWELGANDNHSEFENLRVDVGTGGDLNDDSLSRNYFSIHVNDQSLLNWEIGFLRFLNLSNTISSQHVMISFPVYMYTFLQFTGLHLLQIRAARIIHAFRWVHMYPHFIADNVAELYFIFSASPFRRHIR